MAQKSNNIYSVLENDSSGDSDDLQKLIARNEGRPRKRHNRKKVRYRKGSQRSFPSRPDPIVNASEWESNLARGKDSWPTYVNIYVTNVDTMRNSEPHPVLDLVYWLYPLSDLVAASGLAHERLGTVPTISHDGGSAVRALVIGQQVDEGALKAVLEYIRACRLPFDEGYDMSTAPQMLRPPGKIPNDIKWLCDLYQVYLALNMQHGQLGDQRFLANAITFYFTENQTLIDDEEVLYFWRTCKEDVALTWRVMKQVLAWIEPFGESLFRDYARTFEAEQELRFLWENRCGRNIVVPDADPERDAKEWAETVKSWLAKGGIGSMND